MSFASSSRARICLGSLAAVIAGLLAAACGSDAANADVDPSLNPDGGAATETGAAADGGTDGPSVDGPFTFRDRLAGWSGGYTGGWYRAHGYAMAGKRLFSLPDALSTSLGAVTVVDIAAPKARVFSLPVTGKVPSGTVEAFVYEPASDRIVLVVRPKNATAVSLVSLALGDKDATFTTLTQASAPSTSASLVGPLYASGGGVIVAGLGNQVASFTIAGTTATWAARAEASLFPGNYAGVAEDPTHGRILGFGETVFVPGEPGGHVEPKIRSLALAPPYAWSTMPFSGDAPPNGTVTGSASFFVLDEQGNRVLVSAQHDGTCGAIPCKTNGLWSFDLGSHVWTKLADQWSNPHAQSGLTPYLVQQDARRMLEPTDGVLVATSLDTSKSPNLDGVPLAQDGDLGPVYPVGVTVHGDQRIVSTDGLAFRVLDPTKAAPRWERLGTAKMPSTIGRGSSIAADPKTGEILVFGSTLSSQQPAAELHLLSADAKTMTKVATASAPPPRINHGSLVVDGTLYIAGGTVGDLGTTALDDVWAFDRAASTWTKVATLPTAIALPTLSVSANNELLVMGRVVNGATDVTDSQVFAVERTTHAVRTMAGSPVKSALWAMASYHGCFVGYESGDTADSSGVTVWRCTVENGATKWTSSVLAEHDFTVRDLRGAGAPDGLRAYFVGRHLWEAIGK